MRHFEYMRHVGNRMAEIGLEPTREDFSDWINDPHALNLTDERRSWFQEQYAQNKSLGELIDHLTEDELFGWYWFLDFLVEERTLF